MKSEYTKDVQDNNQNWRQRLGWLVVDRILFGLIVVAIAFAFNAYLQRDQKLAEYQKVLFEKRVKAYEELTAVSRDARDRCTLAYRILLARTPSTKAADVAWQVRLAAAEKGIWELAADPRIGDAGGDGGGGAGGGLPLPQLFKWQADALSDAVKALREVEGKRTEASLYVSESVNSKVDRLLETLLKDIETLKIRVSKTKGPFLFSMSVDDKHFIELAISHAEESYSNLLKAITETLRVKDMILG